MENPIFDELSFQIFKNTQKSKIVCFLNFVHLFEKGVSQFEAKGWLFSSLEKLFFTSYFTKSRRDVQKRYMGVTRHGESEFRWIIFSKFWKSSIVENSKIPKFKKMSLFPNNPTSTKKVLKSMLPLKHLRISLRSFLVLNGQDRNDSVFFKFGRRRAKRGPSEARSERSEVRSCSYSYSSQLGPIRMMAMAAV